MDVFISWSGARSQAAAQVLKEWLPQVINALKPWVSSADIEKGSRWGAEIADRLSKSMIGIICLTPSNLHSDWILFEAGALSKLEKAHVCTLLIGLEPADIGFPLAQFQNTRAQRDDMFELMRTLNKKLGDNSLSDAHLTQAFETWWPVLEKKLTGLPSDKGTIRDRRSDRDLLEEILGLVRRVNANSNLSEFQKFMFDYLGGDPRIRREPTFAELVFNAVSKTDPKASIRSREIASSGMTIVGTNGRGQEFSVVIPQDTPRPKIRELVKKQILGLHSTGRVRRTIDKKTSPAK